MTKIEQNPISKFIGQVHQTCQKGKKSEKLFGGHHVNRSLRPVAAAAAAAVESGRGGGAQTGTKT